jgi:phosphatidylglycerol:prolipoprotein diacylglycerol transferase
MALSHDSVRWLEAAPIYALAYIAAAGVFWWAARRRGLATHGIALVMQAGLIGGLLGANLMQLFATGLPGKTIEGGILGGWLAVIWAKRRLGITRPTGDLFAFAIPAGEAIGRIGCFIGGCCYGKVATVAWAVYDHGSWRHPTQLYLSLGALATFAAVVAIDRRRVLPENGLFYVQGMLFCATRFGIEFFRDVAPTTLGLTLAQCGCIAGFAVFAILFACLIKAPRGFEPQLQPSV